MHHFPQVRPLLWSSFGQPILPFLQLDMPHDWISQSKLPITDGVIFIARRMWLLGNHHPARDVSVQANLHGLLQAIPPQGEVLVGHVLVPLVLHLTDVMQAVKVLGLRLVGVPNSPHDFLEAVFEM